MADGLAWLDCGLACSRLCRSLVTGKAWYLCVCEPLLWLEGYKRKICLSPASFHRCILLSPVRYQREQTEGFGPLLGISWLWQQRLWSDCWTAEIWKVLTGCIQVNAILQASYT